MDANQRFDRIDEKLEILIDQVGRLTAGLVDIKLTVERQAVVAERQAETVDRQAETVDRLVKIVDTLLQQRTN